ncbi:hypothetical protein ACIPWL_28285 [Streptomyces sp. NPDC090023]|uniref:hypothetical protein n=1 Tax=unclassified Streptomyces TaxID=2593676 RepID=UPI0038148AB2
MPSHYDVLPDLAFGHHPDHGIVAANPKNLASSSCMLESLDFQPVLDQPTLYTLGDQHRDGVGRTAQAVALLRRIGYRVEADATLDPALNTGPDRFRRLRSGGEPDVAFAEHPHLGVVAATDEHSSAIGSLILEEHGWRLNPNLDIYTLPVTTNRDEALAKVAMATATMHLSDVRVAVHPGLAQDVLARRGARHDVDQTRAAQRPSISTAALAASSTRAGHPRKAPADAPAAAVRPVDPRIAFSRER